MLIIFKSMNKVKNGSLNDNSEPNKSGDHGVDMSGANSKYKGLLSGNEGMLLGISFSFQQLDQNYSNTSKFNSSFVEIQSDGKNKSNNSQPDSVMIQPTQQQQSTNGSPQDIYSEFIGAIKIRDGLFIGDQLAAQDYEFVVTNKVTHIINTSGLQIRNYWESIGVKYLTFDWVDQDCQVILDSNNNNANRIYDFVEEAYEQGES